MIYYQFKMIIYYQAAFQESLYLNVILEIGNHHWVFICIIWNCFQPHTQTGSYRYVIRLRNSIFMSILKNRLQCPLSSTNHFCQCCFFHTFGALLCSQKHGASFQKSLMIKIVRIVCNVRTNIKCKFHGRLHALVARRHFQRSITLTTSFL